MVTNSLTIMATPLIPTITSAKAALSVADTSALLAAIFAINPLPSEKAASTVRTLTINIQPGTLSAGSTSTVTVAFTP